MKTLLTILTVASLTGCAHRARHFTAPDASKIGAANSRLAARVTEARATALRASSAVRAAQASSRREGRAITAIVPRVERLLRMSPVELRPEIEALKVDVATLQAVHEETAGNLASAVQEQGKLTGQLEEATAAKNEVAKYSPAYLLAVEQQTAALNKAEAGWAKDSAEIVRLKMHSWLYRLAATLGLIALAGLAFLYFTGRIATAGASMAARS